MSLADIRAKLDRIVLPLGVKDVLVDLLDHLEFPAPVPAPPEPPTADPAPTDSVQAGG